MRIGDLLSLDRIDVALAARDKASVIDALAAMLARGAAGVSVQDVARAMREREAQVSTGVGDGVALPHGRVAGLTQLVAALALAPQGVDFDAIDGQPVRLFVAIIAPERASGEHVRALASVSRLLNDDATRARLLAARDADEALRIVRGEA